MTFASLTDENEI